MTDKNQIPLGKRSRALDDFVETGTISGRAAQDVVLEGERDVTKTFRLPESLGRRLKVHAAKTGQKEKDILISLISNYLNEHETSP